MLKYKDFFAKRLLDAFPELDIRVNYTDREPTLRYSAPSHSTEIFELNIDNARLEQLLHEAIFTIKEVTQTFDA